MRAYLDANVLLRLIVRVPEAHFARALTRLERARAEGETLVIHPLTLATVFYTLRKFYKLPAREAAQHLLALASLEVMEVEPLALEALDLMAETGVDFDDAYLALKAQEEGARVLSFDRDFAALPGLWEEP